MDFVQKELSLRGVPDALVCDDGTRVTTPEKMAVRREELKRILMENEYGTLPPAPEEVSVEHAPYVHDFCAGKVDAEVLTLSVTVRGKTASFPVKSAIPKGEGKHPAFVHINFRPDSPDRYMPTEEITDRGFALFSFCYQDVAADSADFGAALAPILYDGEREGNAPGKIAMWAWAAMRVMDYVCTLPCIDTENVAVIGHSRLGKTALFTGAVDERFKYVISNDSGCSGAAISRGKTGETIERICKVFPYWFCPAYGENTNPDEKTFDQNFLHALVPPRHLMVGSSEGDAWADPAGEFLGCASANFVYEIYGMKGLVFGESVPAAKAVLDEGDSLYHIRHGEHYLSREDWGVYMDFIEKKTGRKS